MLQDRNVPAACVGQKPAVWNPPRHVLAELKWKNVILLAPLDQRARPDLTKSGDRRMFGERRAKPRNGSPQYSRAARRLPPLFDHLASQDGGIEDVPLQA